MADYPWGAMAPAKRVASVERQIRTNDGKKAAAVEAHSKKMAELDSVEKGLKADLRQAQTVLDREEKDKIREAASKSFEKVIDKLMADGVDVEKALGSKDFMKAIEGIAKAKTDDSGSGAKK